MSKVTFFSNYLNHHQLSFCKKLVELTNNNFKFVSQKAISEKRISFGYQNISNDYDFVVKTYENDEQLQKAYQFAIDSDYVLFGSSNVDYLRERLNQNKITFKYSERMFKKDLSIIEYIKGFRRVYINHTKYRNKNLYMLCSGSYAAYDFNRFGAYKNKTYKWGYFPEFIKHDVDDLISVKKKNSIVWAGRLIDWKHPDLAIELARKLKESDFDFSMKIIGNGEMEDQLKQSIKDYGLEEKVLMMGSMHPEEVRRYMEESEIFLFTSDKQEGWGAVLNEAMNSACACIASHSIGSTGFLLKHKENGYIYKENDLDELYSAVTHYLSNDEDRIMVSKNAYKTISETWNAEVAAERFIKLNECLLNGQDTPYIDGPCSKALCIKENDMYNYLVNENR